MLHVGSRCTHKSFASCLNWSLGGGFCFVFVKFCFVSPVLNSHIHIACFIGTLILGWQDGSKPWWTLCSIPRNLHRGRRESNPGSCPLTSSSTLLYKCWPTPHTYTQIDELKKNKTSILITHWKQIHEVRVGKTLVQYVGLAPSTTSPKL